MIEILSNPTLYDEIASLNLHQSPLRPANPLANPSSSDPSTCGTTPICPAYEGEIRSVNGRDYTLYCYNAPWGSYIWLPTAKTFAECESNCHENNYKCNGLTFYPSTGACALVYSTDAEPYIFDNGYQKIGAVPAKKTDTAFGPGMVCPLPGSDNQVWDFGDNKEFQFKISCINQFQVPAQSKKDGGLVKNVDECGEKCGKDEGCFGFHYYQPIFPGGRVDGMRSCQLIMESVGSDGWVPLYKPNQYLAGLKVGGSYECSDNGWDGDKACRNRRSE